MQTFNVVSQLVYNNNNNNVFISQCACKKSFVSVTSIFYHRFMTVNIYSKTVKGRKKELQLTAALQWNSVAAPFSDPYQLMSSLAYSSSIRHFHLEDVDVIDTEEIKIFTSITLTSSQDSPCVQSTLLECEVKRCCICRHCNLTHCYIFDTHVTEVPLNDKHRLYVLYLCHKA